MTSYFLLSAITDRLYARNQLRLPQGLTRFAYYTGWRKGKILRVYPG